MSLLGLELSAMAVALAILLGRPPQNLTAPGSELGTVQIPQVNLTPPATLLTARWRTSA